MAVACWIQCGVFWKIYWENTFTCIGSPTSSDHHKLDCGRDITDTVLAACLLLVVVAETQENLSMMAAFGNQYNIILLLQNRSRNPTYFKMTKPNRKRLELFNSTHLEGVKDMACSLTNVKCSIST